MKHAEFGWMIPTLALRGYFICLALISVVVLLMPPSFIFVGGPAAWLLLFEARIRDVGKQMSKSAWTIAQR